MKITDIKCYVLPAEGGPPPFHWRRGLRVPDFSGHTLHHAILRVDTDEGITGHAGGPGACDHGGALLAKARRLEMGVRVE